MKVKLKKKDTTSVVSFFLVETKGIEPSTLRMRTVRSPKWFGYMRPIPR